MALATAWIGVTFSSLKSCTVSKTAKPGGSSTSLWSQNPHSFGGKTHWCKFLEVQEFDQAASSCLIKPKSNGYKRDVVNTSIEFHLFEVINSYYFLCNLFSSYGGLWNWTLYAFVVLEVHVTKNSDTEKIQKQQDSCKFEWQVYYFWLCCSPQVLSPWWLEKWLRKGQCGPPPGHRRVQSRLGFFWNQHLRNPWNEKAYVYSHAKWDTFWYFELWLDDGCG